MEGYIGEIRLFAGNFAPRTWAFCQGQLLPISQYSALFSILGTTYGGDGRTTFALPDFRGRASVGTGGNGNQHPLGQLGGQENVTLTTMELPSHSHTGNGAVKPLAMNGQGDETNPGGGFMASSTAGDLYSSSHNTQMGASPLNVTINSSGGNQSHNNMQPYLVMNFIICIQGIFPSRG